MSLAGDLTRAAAAVLAGAPQARVPFEHRHRRWIDYTPVPDRPGVALADLAPHPRKAAHQLLATALGEAAFAQAMAIVALEEVLDRREGGRRNRRSDDYRVIVFGTPGDDVWAWRFEGHHLSVSLTVAGDRVSPAPIFLGANPARVDVLGRPVLRPLGVEEDLGRELLLALSPRAREIAVVADVAPYDIRTATHPRSERISPAGIARSRLRPTERALLDQLVALYLGRLPDELAAALDPAGGEVHFAWEGPPQPGTAHYYRLQADDLVIEFDLTTPDGSHAHTVIRRPDGEFGADLLGEHHGQTG
ncbi:DUF3500 domain-containing protein [Actinoplanes sp. N902-109]|uniref:DUF3500 domain-containing protein n=1 Tax=Actinoplanes sp. (strain N902-109) TaxID=649831 RepID=UPI0003293921|nr:DUF3500 domain-containing protein [Actinoplanes sp. N902-109]AGL18656.1 hypothetical protein L083_5146 [Actinoplanes sp. N902-109]